ncbi:type II restriction endonuclease [Aliifodinibius salipaludis]|uniref:site-specific DNA-methyltransferase (adenine-specific) n=1 Tax=Fodinibius salipaludis TaxID=2032627 RepID=A0A2A2GBH8_9BACT|nr:TaqI-like C-terminal specificity domain-containing protein [Aliifodinibius salipaludis]PAU94223.1 type II restriction endonuclease [Aliifodinibius salipaludis]
MQIETISPRRVVDNAFLQESITETEFETFRQRLLKLLNQADDAVEEGESEEHLKNLIKPFFSNTNFEEDHYINTKERQDLAIHNGKTRKSNVGVIIEAKRPSNKSGMITRDDLNRKAFHESILYYLRERIDNGNEDIKHIIITDVYNWYIFDAQDFERHFYESKKLQNWYEEWKQGQKVSSRTQFVYDHLSEFVDELEANITAAELDLSNYRKLLEKDELSRDEQKKLVPVFKLFTPTHLLKQPFASDSNELNKAFYRELLYIMGLKEYKEKGTHYITRLDEENRQHASLIENTITQLKSLNVISRLPNRSEFGDDEEEQLFNVAIQLLITWINRILFLKLLESQLFKYHREDDRFRFLSHRDIDEYDGLNKLFFQVLAVPVEDRSERINKHFGHIPYLNSSLFDVADIEQDTIRISELEDGLQMPVYNRSKIRNRDGERLKGEKLSALEYLLRFLDAYNFNTEGTAEVQKEAKTLINASVLGRIFEKINGYKDGSFFTPGYITEYMCRETIRRAVVQKFNETYGNWDCEDIDDVAAKISRHEIPYNKANEVVNSITICDPAVGSGHFLVSALNELIAIKSDLRIFVDEDNHRIRDVEISVDNDELSISVGQDPFFEYRVHSKWKENGTIERTVGPDTQRLQKALFREKNILIENCLFGVDINPNSVNICRLRLWIELLKHAYYKESTDFQQLEVLPNIDINIKQGNSLVSRFDLDADLSQILANNDDLTIEDYKQAVRRYKETGDRENKRALKEQIKTIKDNFEAGLEEQHEVRQELKKQREILIKEEAKLDLFEGEKKSKKEQKKITKTKKKIGKLEEELEELENATFYDQAFEWRFEFPEVLDEDGNFTGFDVLIANPPYGTTLTSNEKQYLKNKFYAVKGNYDVYSAFIELGHMIGKADSYTSYITPVSWLTGSNYKWLREHLKDERTITQAIILPYDVFEDAYIDTGIYLFQNKKRDSYNSEVFEFHPREKISDDELNEISWKILPSDYWENEEKYEIIFKPTYYEIKNKALKESSLLEEICDTTRGILANDGDVYDTKGKDRKRYFIGDLYRYTLKEDYKWVKYGDNLREKPGEYSYFKGERILIRRLISRQFRMMGTLTKKEFVNKKDIYNVLLIDDSFRIKYILSLINSSFFSYLVVGGSSLASKDDFSQLTLTDIRTLPIKETNNKNQKKFEKKVDQILTAKEENPEADTSELEEEIDQLVYKLYGLSEEEIGIVEESVG